MLLIPVQTLPHILPSKHDPLPIDVSLIATFRVELHEPAELFHLLPSLLRQLHQLIPIKRRKRVFFQVRCKIRHTNTSLLVREAVDFFKVRFPLGTSIYHSAKLEVVLSRDFRFALLLLLLSALG
jgi:hypothetical protein